MNVPNIGKTRYSTGFHDFKVRINVIADLGTIPIWHDHDGDQILLSVGGSGCYQEKGKESEMITWLQKKN